MLSKLRADWRRGRASKFIRLGEGWTYEYKTPVGPMILVGRFEAEDETLILIFREIYAKDILEKGPYRADGGLENVRRFLEWVAGMAIDLGYTRMRVEGTRTTRKRRGAGRQRFEFDLARYLRGSRGSR
ncbi:MAG TPA: hypothetical protein VLJ76_09445 [Gaiellaceae bacterium]|nr:hypothetical protein [Gaiellaceae bacterium]